MAQCSFEMGGDTAVLDQKLLSPYFIITNRVALLPPAICTAVLLLEDTIALC